MTSDWPRNWVFKGKLVMKLLSKTQRVNNNGGQDADNYCHFNAYIIIKNCKMAANLGF